ncbi:MAG TPA: hypothetical protein VHD63_03775 [Ktedonobacteraceae bacterium]|nr:hypothetical protein [Ktedonobacteraceae bacterium]
MWNRFQPVAWVAAILFLLLSSTGIAHAATVPANHQYPSTTTTTTTTATAADFSKFAGQWVAHSAFLIISPDGSANFGARTYNWCGPDVPQPCDSLSGNQLRYGYHARIELSNVRDSVAYGTVTESNQQPDNVDTTVTLTLGPADTLIYSNNGSVLFLCGPRAPAGTCGA